MYVNIDQSAQRQPSGEKTREGTRQSGPEPKVNRVSGDKVAGWPGSLVEVVGCMSSPKIVANKR